MLAGHDGAVKVDCVHIGGGVYPASVPRFSAFASVYHFVESLPCPMPRKPA